MKIQASSGGRTKDTRDHCQRLVLVAENDQEARQLAALNRRIIAEDGLLKTTTECPTCNDMARDDWPKGDAVTCPDDCDCVCHDDGSEDEEPEPINSTDASSCVSADLKAYLVAMQGGGERWRHGREDDVAGDAAGHDYSAKDRFMTLRDHYVAILDELVQTVGGPAKALKLLEERHS